MGLRRRKMIKTPQKTFLPGPPKTCWVYFVYIFKNFRYGLILYAKRIFCRVLFSFHRSLNKTTVLQQNRFFFLFFLARHHKYAFKTTKDVSSKNLAHNVLRVDVVSVVREVSQQSLWKTNIFAPGSFNCGTTFSQICLPTVFGERALPLYILKLPGRPRQGPLSVLGTVCTASLPRKIPHSVVHMAYIRTIFASCKFLDEYRVCLNTKFNKILSAQVTSVTAFISRKILA